MDDKLRKEKERVFYLVIGLIALGLIFTVSNPSFTGFVTGNFTVNITENITINDTTNITIDFGENITVNTTDFNETVNISIHINETTANESNITEYVDDQEQAVLEVMTSNVEINKLVKWTKKIEGSKIKEYKLPQNSFNIKTDQDLDIREKVVKIKDKDIIEIEYYTEGPSIKEKSLGRNKKQVTISSDLHYENVLTYTSIPESREELIKVYWLKGSGKELFEDIEYIDTNNNGLIDKLQWIIPHLSEQTFEIIIEITKAEHLDENKEFISNIYDEVISLDKIWSEKIYHNEFIRVNFEKNLTSDKDITVYVRNTQQLDTKIEVYYYDSSIKITEFPVIKEEKYYKIYLTDMQGIQDKFDLRLVNEDNNENAYLEFDHIIDPISVVNITNCAAEDQGAKGSFGSACQDINNLLIDDGITENHTFDKNNYAGILTNVSNSSITDCDSIKSVEICYEWWHSGSRAPVDCDISIDANGGSSYTVVTTTCPSTSPNPGLACVNVTTNETWLCSHFFGASGQRALAKSEISRETAGPNAVQTAYWDALYFNVTYNISTGSNNDPVITWVNSSVSENPVEAGTRTINIQFNATDTDGVGDLNDTTATIYLNMTGEITRYNDSCTPRGNSGNTETYDCAIDMQYYDKDGSWTINASIMDNQEVYAENTTETFTYGSLTAMVLGKSSMNFSNTQLGQQDEASDQNPQIINNRGNVNITQVNITAFDLIKGSEKIEATYFTANYTDGSGYGYQLQNNTMVTIGTYEIARDINGNDQNGTIYLYVDIPAAGITSGKFISYTDWLIDVQ